MGGPETFLKITVKKTDDYRKLDKQEGFAAANK